jgi:hypothetical protein
MADTSIFEAEKTAAYLLKSEMSLDETSFDRRNH